jgi:hypothetical protein
LLALAFVINKLRKFLFEKFLLYILKELNFICKPSNLYKDKKYQSSTVLQKEARVGIKNLYGNVILKYKLYKYKIFAGVCLTSKGFNAKDFSCFCIIFQRILKLCLIRTSIIFFLKEDT